LCFCSTTFVWNVSHSKKKLARYDYKCILAIMWSAVILVIFWRNFVFFSTDFRIILKYEISWQSVRWEPSCTIRTGRRT
jgi:hypothetical protein